MNNRNITDRDETAKKPFKHGFYRDHGKRILDILLSGFALIILSPLLLLLVFLVRIFHGSPVFFTPTRPGKDEKIFKLYKFRTMSNATDKEGKLLPEKDRITKLGKFLRTTSLDEIPELINIFIGDMSIVGPRPFAMKYLPYYNEEERVRHSVRPGLTGLAQISGRNNLPWPQRFEKDLEYVNSISLRMDLTIILGTVKKLFGDSDVIVPGSNKYYQFDTFRVIEDEGSIPDGVQRLTYPEVGGEFWLDDKMSTGDISNDMVWLPRVQDSSLTLSGRTAITLALRDAKKGKDIKRAYVPSYLSFPMLQPFIQENIGYSFYEVSYKKSRIQYSIDHLTTCDVILISDYFGLPSNDNQVLIKALRERGCVVIYDITHTLLNPIAETVNADYYVASLRKWFPIPAGGYLGKVNGILQVKPNLPSDDAVKTKLEAMKEKKEYIFGLTSDKIGYLEKMSAFESDLVQLDPMLQIDETSADALKKINIEQVKKRRKENAETLIKHLSGVSGIRILNDPDQIKSIVPFYVPIYLEHNCRNRLKSALRNKGFYCPVHWQETMGASVGIRANELSLVCDQRYLPDDMIAMASVIKQTLLDLD